MLEATKQASLHRLFVTDCQNSLSIKRLKVIVLPFLAIVFTSSCTNAAPKPTPLSKTKTPVSKPKTANPQSSKPTKKSPYISELLGDLTPKPSGAGILVGEPVVLLSQGEKAALSEFGAACSRWLQFHVGGQGEAGKTPLWSSVEATRRELHKPDLRLALRDIKRVKQALGVTHVALSTIKKLNEPDRYSLQYRLYKTADVVAPPELLTFSLEGTEAEILAQLPERAKTLSETLKVKSPSIPQAIQLQPEEMRLLGRGGWTFAKGLSAEELKALHLVAVREPLAALLSLEYESRTDVQTEWQYELERSFYFGQTFSETELVRNMVDILMAKENALSLAEICAIDTKQLNPYKNQVLALINKHKYNYAYRVVASKWCVDQWSDYKLSTQMARNTVQCSPQNPYAWLLYGGCISAEAEQLRNGRYSHKITPKEWEALNRNYEQHYATARKATTLDPENSKAWHDLAEAAVFAGYAPVADSAFWKGYKLEPDDLYELRWGLEMYQPKWIDDTKNLAKVVALASTPKNLAWLYPDVARTLRAIGEEEQIKTSQQIASKELEAQYLPERTDIMALSRLTNPSFGSAGRWGRYSNIIKLRPKSTLTYWLTALDKSNSNPKEASFYYGQAAQLDPRNMVVIREGAYMKLLANQLEEAVKGLQDYLKINPNDWSANNQLGWAYYQMDKTDLALEYYTKSLKMNPKTDNPRFYYCLSDLQTRSGLIDEAIDNGRKGIKYSSEYGYDEFRTGWAHAFYAWALYKKGRLKEAMAECNIALNFSKTTNPAAHQCLGEIYLAQGDLAKARIEWEQVLIWGKVSNPGPERGSYYIGLAQAMLEKHPAP